MSARKRNREEMEAPQSASHVSNGLLHRLRNTWYFANVFQFIQLFGTAVNITDDYDIEDFEEDCLTPGHTRLSDVALALAKCTRSRNDRGTIEYLARKTFLEHSPSENPFGERGGDDEKEFLSFDIFTKLRVIHDLSRWVWYDPENKFKTRALKNDDDEEEWRINEFGWDADERSYFVLDDNRLYRRTRAPPPPPPPPKAKAKKNKSKAAPKPRSRGTRRSTRGRVETSEEPEDVKEEDLSDTGDVDDGMPPNGEDSTSPDDGLGGDGWECLCITLQDYSDFLESIRKSRDSNEKTLRKRIMDHVMPIIQSIEEERAKKIARRQRELVTLEKMATAKRSSRIASKADREKADQEARDAEDKRRKDLAAAQKDAERQKQMDHDRQSRMQTREQRQRDREYKRILHEEELKKLEEEQERLENGEVDAKKSERQLKAELKKKQEALEQLQEEEDWVFDCAACGVHGANVDDGKHSIACERCNVWQHSACLGLSQQQAENDNFHFMCDDCKRKDEDAKKPKIAPLRFNFSPSQQVEGSQPQGPPFANGSSASNVQISTNKPAQQLKRKAPDDGVPGTRLPPMKKFAPHKHSQSPPTGSTSQTNGSSIHSSFLNGPTLSPQGQVQDPVNGNRPPGLVSPQKPTHNLSSYSPSQPMQFGPPLHGSSVNQPPTANGFSPQKATAVPITPGQKDPFRNTFSSHAPGSSHSRTSPYQGQAPILSGGQQMPPPQTTPNTSFKGNGTFQHATPSTPAQHPYVPQKQPSAAPSPAPSMNLSAASPPMAPTVRPDAATAGLSPIKNSPPRPASRDLSTKAAVPPFQKLVPSPKQTGRGVTGAESPTKAATPPPAASFN